MEESVYQMLDRSTSCVSQLSPRSKYSIQICNIFLSEYFLCSKVQFVKHCLTISLSKGTGIVCSNRIPACTFHLCQLHMSIIYISISQYYYMNCSLIFHSSIDRLEFKVMILRGIELSEPMLNETYIPCQKVIKVNLRYS